MLRELDELMCPSSVRSCYECNRPASRCPQEQEKLRECAHCKELVSEDKGRECWLCGDWLCNACAAWTERDGNGHLICGTCDATEDENEEVRHARSAA